MEERVEARSQKYVFKRLLTGYSGSKESLKDASSHRELTNNNVLRLDPQILVLLNILTQGARPNKLRKNWRREKCLFITLGYVPFHFTQYLRKHGVHPKLSVKIGHLFDREPLVRDLASEDRGQYFQSLMQP